MRIDVRVSLGGTAIARIATALERLASVAERAVGPVAAHGLRFQITGEREDVSMSLHFITARISWDKPPADADVGAQEMTITVAGEERQPELLSRFVTHLDVEGLVGGVVHAALINIDRAGNRQVGEPATLDFVLADTIPPPDAGPLGVAMLSERFEEDPVVDPPVDPADPDDPA